MYSEKDEIQPCPTCGKRTRHRVMRDRKLAPVLWCQSCFNVRVEGPTEQVGREQAA